MEHSDVLFRGGCYVFFFFVCLLVLASSRSRTTRQSVLLAASISLYLTWAPWFTAVLFSSILVNFLMGKWLQRNPRWAPLSIGLIFNLALLGVFKYLPDLAARTGFDSLHGIAGMALPLGISFWTFQAMSYLFDVYRGEELDPTFIEFALFLSFFPVTISGPICRLPEMLPQFRSQQTTTMSDIAQGLRRIAIGVLMLQLAKLLGQGILSGDGVIGGFDHADQWTALDVWCLAFGYGLQLFFDFAGYTHIAIGAAKVLGFALPENFERPFASTTLSAFWTRWHMSLSFWIRDYFFFPLATARREVWWRNLILGLSMVAFGLWHRATLLFVIWGAYHGVLLVAHRQLQQWERKVDWQPPERLWSLLSWIVTASLISLGWIFFRANSWQQAMHMLSAIVAPASYFSHLLSSSLYVLIASLAGGYTLVVALADVLDQHTASTQAPDRRSLSGPLAALARWRWFWVPSLYVLVLFFVFLVTHGQQASASQFMYRQF